MALKKKTWTRVPRGSELEITTENATDKVFFAAQLREGGVEVIRWKHEELFNRTADAAVLEGNSTKTVEFDSIFTGEASYDVYFDLYGTEGDHLRSWGSLGVADPSQVRFVLTLIMER